MITQGHQRMKYTRVRATPEEEGGSSGGESSSALSNYGRYGLLAVLVLTAVAALALSGGVGELIQAVEAAVEGSGVLGPIIYIACYAAATVLLFPASVLTLAAGVLFGPLKGTAIVSLASTLGATLAFVVSRYIARPIVQEKLSSQYPKLQAVVDAVSSQGLKIVFLLRLSPLFPFGLLNYALGLTTISLPKYVLASWGGMLPATFAYVFLGTVGKEAAEMGGSGSFSAGKIVLYVVGAAATLLAVKVASSAASKALQDAESADDKA